MIPSLRDPAPPQGIDPRVSLVDRFSGPPTRVI